MQLTLVSPVFRWPWPNWASAFADAQFGIINNQQPLSSYHHPRHLAPPSPTATAAHTRRRPPTNMAHDHQQQCGNATSLSTMTTRTNNPKWWPAPTNRHRQWRAKVRQLASPPIAFSDRRCCLLLLLGHHGEYPLSTIPPNPPYSDTGQHMARQGQRHCTMTQQGQHNNTDKEDEPQWWHNQTRDDDEQAMMTSRQHGPMTTQRRCRMTTRPCHTWWQWGDTAQQWHDWDTHVRRQQWGSRTPNKWRRGPR